MRNIRVTFYSEKTFTVDPISKRRLENLGEEDRFHIRDHHQPIVSEETFARAQEIRERRNGGRKSPTPGETRKSIADSMHLAVCWNVVSAEQVFPDEDGIAVQNTETIWQCVKSTKSGKRY